jgi:hypothetical protein
VNPRYDITGREFNRLTVLGYAGKNKHNNNLWNCRCKCRNEIIVESHSLICGNTKSCGCLQKEKATITLLNMSMTHGLSRDKNHQKTRLYRIWAGIRTRCLNSNDKTFKNYGQRGICICNEWKNNFKVFHDWAIANGYSDNLTIERINNDGDYEPSNCKWADDIEQANNKRTSRIITFNGMAKTLSQWAKYYNINYNMLFERLKRGWTFEKAITTPRETRFLRNKEVEE